MAYNSVSIKPYTKSHLELQREITLIELAPSPYFFVLSICLAYMNMFARFDENPAMTLQDIKETKRYGRTDGRTDGQRENSIPTTNKVCGGYKKKNLEDETEDCVHQVGIMGVFVTFLHTGCILKLTQKSEC